MLAAYAGLAHLVAAPEHFASWWPAGAFFVAVGLGQLAYVVTAVRRPSALAIAATLFLNLGVVLVYVASRTVGVGIGPSTHAEQGLEPVGPFDLSVAAAEVALIALVTVGLGPKARTRALDGLLAGRGVAVGHHPRLRRDLTSIAPGRGRRARAPTADVGARARTRGQHPLFPAVRWRPSYPAATARRAVRKRRSAGLVVSSIARS